MREITDRWERALASGARLGESARWDEGSARLYWVDINSHEVHRFDPGTGADAFVTLWDHVGMVALTSTDELIAAVGTAVYAIADFDAALDKAAAAIRDRAIGTDQATGRSAVADRAAIERTDPRVRRIAQLDDPAKETRANDGVVDPEGRLFVGTMSLKREPWAGSLYRVTGSPGGADAAAELLTTGIGVSNGIGWNPDQTRMYYIDTHTHRVDAFDYDRATGAIANRRPFVTVSEELGRPDGMTTDATGDLWVAMWQGDAVTHWSGETGELIEVFRLPAACITSCAFGGAGFRDLYVTSAADDQENPSGPADHDPGGGDLFVIKDVGPGGPGHRYKL